MVTDIETVSGPCNTCFWYAQAPVVRNTSRGGASVYFGEADNATGKSRVGLPYCVLPECRSHSGLFSASAVNYSTIGAWIHACDITMQYGFVLHCCDVIALCTASHISNKMEYCIDFKHGKNMRGTIGTNRNLHMPYTQRCKLNLNDTEQCWTL